MSSYKIEKKDYSEIKSKIKIAIISAEFNRNYTKELESKNIDFLKENWFENISKYLVPWAFEIPWFAKVLLENESPDLVLCFGVVIRWETTHYEMVADQSARWIMDLSLINDSVMINGILTCENEKQVEERITNTYALSWLNMLSEINKIK